MPILTRREVLIGAAAAGAATFIDSTTEGFATAAQPSTPVNFDVPAGACDTHTHIFGDPKRFPLDAHRVYTPEPASIKEMRAFHRALHTTRVIVVNPSIYGTDNSCTLDAIKQFGSIARGVAVIGEKSTEADLDELHRGGIRGIRINLETVGQKDPAVARQNFQAFVDRIKGRKWQIEIYTRPTVIEAIKDQIAASPVPVVLDHFGGANAALGTQQPGFESLLGLLQPGKIYVKISAPYRASKEAPDYPEVTPLAKALIAANPERILWGSDWPHPATPVDGRPNSVITPLTQVDDGRIFNLLPLWAPQPALRKTILVENPARLFGF